MLRAGARMRSNAAGPSVSSIAPHTSGSHDQSVNTWRRGRTASAEATIAAPVRRAAFSGPASMLIVVTWLGCGTVGRRHRSVVSRDVVIADAPGPPR